MEYPYHKSNLMNIRVTSVFHIALFREKSKLIKSPFKFAKNTLSLYPCANYTMYWDISKYFKKTHKLKIIALIFIANFKDFRNDER